MNGYQLVLLLCALVLRGGSDKSGGKGRTYRAAVYEHVAVAQDDPTVVLNRSQVLDIMMQNLHVYSQQAEIASRQNVSMIVFPESGLYGLGHTRASIHPYLEEIQDPGLSKNIPCDDVLYPPIQRYLSCIARNNSIYVVANMGDVRVCNKGDNSYCPSDGWFQFSANVVYDAEGKQVALYHKRHLFNDSRFDPAPIAEHSTFATPFGNFATLVHDDLFYNDTAVYLWWNYNIDSVAVTSSARNNFPYTVSVAAHRGFSMLFLYNVLSAGLSDSKTNRSGSGLFAENCGVYHLNLNTTSGKLLVRDMPVKPNSTKPCGPYDPDLMWNHQMVDDARQRMNTLDNSQHAHLHKQYRTPVKLLSSHVDEKEVLSKYSDYPTVLSLANTATTEEIRENSELRHQEDWVPYTSINFQSLIKGDNFTITQVTENEHYQQVCQGTDEHCCSLFYNMTSNPNKSHQKMTYPTGSNIIRTGDSLGLATHQVPITIILPKVSSIEHKH